MKRALIIIAALVSVGCYTVTVTVTPADAGARKRNQLDHVKTYRTCPTCPRGTTYSIYDAGSVICIDRKVDRVGYNAYGERLADWWQRGTLCYNSPPCYGCGPRSMRWDAGVGFGSFPLNCWSETSRDVHKNGSNGDQTHYAWRYRRTSFHMQCDVQAWKFHFTQWIAQTFKVGGGYHPAWGH